MPKSYGKGSSGGGITVGSTTSNGTANTLLKTNGSGQAANATGLVHTTTQELMITSQVATNIPATIRGHASQNGNLLVLENNSGTELVTWNSNGDMNVEDRILTFSYSSNVYGGWHPVQGGFMATPNAGYMFSNASNFNTIDAGIARFSAGVIKTTNGSTGISSLVGGGAAVASATALPLPTGRVFHVTGTTTITSITSTNLVAGVVITLIFDGVLTFTDGSNLKLAGNFVTTADDTITLVYDGTNFYEICRSVN